MVVVLLVLVLVLVLLLLLLMVLLLGRRRRWCGCGAWLVAIRGQLRRWRHPRGCQHSASSYGRGHRTRH